jgi:hypothetical protein
VPKTYVGEKTTSRPMPLRKLDIHMQKSETRPSLSSCTKINSKWIIDLNIRPKTLNLLLENIGKTPEDTGAGKDFLNRIPIAQGISKN